MLKTHFNSFLKFGYKNPLLKINRNKLALQLILMLITLNTLRYIFDYIIWYYAGPLSLIAAFALATYFNRINNLSWIDFGLQKRKWDTIILFFLLLAVLLILFTAVAHQVAELFFEKLPKSTDRFGDLKDNLPLTIFWLVNGIVVAGFGEELIYRGYLINSLERLIGNGVLTKALIIGLPAMLWAARHYYFSGAYGSVIVLFTGILFGVFYIFNGRNLWPLIIAHSIIDCLAFIGRYYDWGFE